jgi:hypothetical protein
VPGSTALTGGLALRQYDKNDESSRPAINGGRPSTARSPTRRIQARSRSKGVGVFDIRSVGRTPRQEDGCAGRSLERLRTRRPAACRRGVFDTPRLTPKSAHVTSTYGLLAQRPRPKTTAATGASIKPTFSASGLPTTCRSRVFDSASANQGRRCPAATWVRSMRRPFAVKPNKLKGVVKPRFSATSQMKREGMAPPPVSP